MSLPGGGLGSTRKSREEERVEEAPAEREKRDRSRSPRERRRRSRSPKPVSRSQERRPRASRPERGAEREAGVYSGFFLLDFNGAA